jgi:hypothetical protein
MAPALVTVHLAHDRIDPIGSRGRVGIPGFAAIVAPSLVIFQPVVHASG